MKSVFSKTATTAVVALAALTSVAASAETFNSFLWDQMKAPSTRTRAEVRAEVLQAQGAGTVATSGYNGATAQQTLETPRAEKPGVAPQAAARLEKSSAQ